MNLVCKGRCPGWPQSKDHCIGYESNISGNRPVSRMTRPRDDDIIPSGGKQVQPDITLFFSNRVIREKGLYAEVLVRGELCDNCSRQQAGPARSILSDYIPRHSVSGTEETPPTTASSHQLKQEAEEQCHGTET